MESDRTTALKSELILKLLNTLRVPSPPPFFIYAIMRKPSVLEISIRSRMNFVRIDVLLESARNSVSVFLMLIAVTI